MTKLLTEQFIELAEPQHREYFANALSKIKNSADWANAQLSFLNYIDNYLNIEIGKPLDANIGQHEAGGQFRIAFPHLAVRKDEAGVRDYMHELMKTRKAWTDENFYHGFPDCAEVHHEIETYLYFQMPLLYWQLPGHDIALQSITDVAHHTGNWASGVPDWYDWENHGFVSTWLGTEKVRDYPPYDYQEANHFRFIDVAMAAYLGLAQGKYMELICDYADTWCDHIETCASNRLPIRCSILPPHVKDAGEMGFSGSRKDNADDYKVFYNTVHEATAYDVAAALLDIYKVSGEIRYLNAARLIIDQFFKNGEEGRPARSCRNGVWENGIQKDPSDRKGLDAAVDVESLNELLELHVPLQMQIASLALKYDMTTGQEYYRKPILDWAESIDEESNYFDQMMSSVLIAAHHYTGYPSYLTRAYAMALRLAAVVEHVDGFHQCNWRGNRQGTKQLMNLLYQPLIGGSEWGVRGNLLDRRYEHRTGRAEGLPSGVVFRSWKNDNNHNCFEAVNTTDQPKAWSLYHLPERRNQICPAKVEDNGVHIQLAASEKLKDSFDF